MLPLGLTLTALALALLAWGLRGRVVARGAFCRRCKFDLAGLDQLAPCPECGRKSDRPRSRLRARRPVPIIAALMALLAAAAVWSTQSAPVQTWLLPRLPDRALVVALDLGMDGADTEIEARLMDPTRTSERLVPIVEQALVSVLKERSNAPLDQQRYLVAALAGTQLTPDQLQRFVDAAYRIELHMRDIAGFNQTTIPVSAHFVQVDGMFDASVQSIARPGYSAVYSLDRSDSPDPMQWFTSDQWPQHATMDHPVGLSGGSMG